MNENEPDELRRTVSEIRKRIEALSHLNIQLRRQLELAEILIPRVNMMIEQLYSIRMVDSSFTIGRTIQQRPYSSREAPDDSGQVFQAVLSVPKGIGVLVLDSEECCTHDRHPWLRNHDARSRFLQFENCPDAIKALLVPEIGVLLNRFLTMLHVAGS